MNEDQSSALDSFFKPIARQIEALTNNNLITPQEAAKATEDRYEEWQRRQRISKTPESHIENYHALPLNNNILIRASYELHYMLELLGYSLSHIEEDHHSIMRGNEHIATITEDFFIYHTPGEIIAYLEYIIRHHHVMCKQCKTPLLQHRNIEHAICMMQCLARPSMVLEAKEGTTIDEAMALLTKYPTMFPEEAFTARIDPDIDDAVQRAIIVEYRETTKGPESTPLWRCPQCHQELNENTVSEVIDNGEQ